MMLLVFIEISHTEFYLQCLKFIKITLSEDLDKNKTNLVYTGSAQVGGKLAQVGSRLIGGVIKNTADDFFQTFNIFSS